MNKKQPLPCAPNPCESCPYRRDTPPGVWHPEEYRKLATYDRQGGFAMPNLALFLCHHSPELKGDVICRGWLTVHADSNAVRLAWFAGQVTEEQVMAPVDVPLYRSGAEAARAGLKGCKRPSAAARRLIKRMAENRLRREAKEQE